MKNTARKIAVLCVAACALAAGTAQAASVNPTKITGSVAKGQNATTAKVKIAAKTAKGAGKTVVKFSLPCDGYIIPLVDGTGTAKINAAIAYPLSGTQSVSNLKSSSSGNSVNSSHSVGFAAMKSDPGIVKFTVYKDSACRKAAASSLKNVRAESVATSYEGAYLKKGAYYMQITNTKKTAQTEYVAVGYVPRKSGTESLSANKWAVGTAPSDSGFSTYRIKIPSKKTVSLGAFGAKKAEIRNSAGKVVAKGSGLLGEIYLHGRNASLGIGLGSPNSYRYLTAKLAKGTYTIRVYGCEPHLVRWTMK